MTARLLYYWLQEKVHGGQNRADQFLDYQFFLPLRASGSGFGRWCFYLICIDSTNRNGSVQARAQEPCVCDSCPDVIELQERSSRRV